MNDQKNINDSHENSAISETINECSPPEQKVSDERYEAFIDNIQEGVYETDVHGNFSYFNDSFCKIFTYPREEILGRNYSFFMDKNNARKAYLTFTKVWVTRQGFSDIVWEIVGKDGQKRIIELSAQVVKDENGRKKGFRGVARDVTQKFKDHEALWESELRFQHQVEMSKKAEKRYKTLLDFVPYPLVGSTLSGNVTYLNPAFSKTFGWTFEELRGKKIPFVPANRAAKASNALKRLHKEKVLERYETKRLTKDGKLLDVILKGTILPDIDGDSGNVIVLLRDITSEKRMARNNEALLRISMALPKYPDLDDLMDYVCSEIKRLLNTDGALVILLDHEKQELFYEGAAYDDSATQKRAKNVRVPVETSIAGKVIKSGQPIIIPDTSKEPNFNPFFDQKIGFKTHNILEVPLQSNERSIGVLCAINKKEGEFDQTDIELLEMIAGTVTLSIENARYSAEVKEAYMEVTSLNKAKDKVINHLSHELKTPLSVLLASLNILNKKLTELPAGTWEPTFERARRNLDRILEIQYQVEDIMENKEYRTQGLLSSMLEQCADELESLVAEEVGEGQVVQKIKERIHNLFSPEKEENSTILLDDFVKQRIESLESKYAHRPLDIDTEFEKVPEICVPEDVINKVIDGLIRNAIENTPDNGRIEIKVSKKGTGVELLVKDYGIGITEEDQRRIFEGFFTTQETMSYSSKRPYDFNAGGKGADLLRMKIFSERYNFRIHMESTRCSHIPGEKDICPGDIEECAFCEKHENCHQSGGTSFYIFFPFTSEKACAI